MQNIPVSHKHGCQVKTIYVIAPPTAPAPQPPTLPTHHPHPHPNGYLTIKMEDRELFP